MDIVGMFKHRDEMFYQETMNILTEMSPILTGSARFIDDTYGTDPNRKLVWEGINLIEGMITLVGVVSYAPGSTLMFDDELMNVTDDNSDYFQQLIRLGIPMPVAMKASADEVYDHLLALQENDVQQHKINDVAPIADFNLDLLTDEQKRSLTTFSQQTNNIELN